MKYRRIKGRKDFQVKLNIITVKRKRIIECSNSKVMFKARTAVFYQV